MKSAVFALFLGCSALVYGLAVQSNVPQTTDVKTASALTAGLERLRLLPLKGAVVQLPAPVLPKLPEPKLLSKAETLSLISDAAAKYKVPAPFVISIVAAESNFNCAAVSPKGAVGLMQLMPDTASQYGAADPSIPAQNVDAGTHYLRWLMDRYQKRESSVIAAYNAGPGNVDRYHGVPPFRETRNYVARVLGFLKQFSPAPSRVRNRWLMAREMQYFPR